MSNYTDSRHGKVKCFLRVIISWPSNNEVTDLPEGIYMKFPDWPKDSM